jgi:hypothetical protein
MPTPTGVLDFAGIANYIRVGSVVPTGPVIFDGNAQIGFTVIGVAEDNLRMGRGWGL